MPLFSKPVGCAILVLAVAASARAADQLPPVDADFLEYLGTVDREEDWILFEDQDIAPPPQAQKPASKPSEDDADSAPKQTEPKQK